MEKYTISFVSRGSLTIEADSFEDAESKFVNMESDPLWNELKDNGVELEQISNGNTIVMM